MSNHLREAWDGMQYRWTSLYVVTVVAAIVTIDLSKLYHR